MGYGPELALKLASGTYCRDLREQLTLFSRFLLFHLAIKGLHAALSPGRPVDYGVACGFVICLLLSLRRRSLQLAIWCALPVLCVRLASFFPSTANLSGLEFLSLLFLSIAHLEKPDDQQILSSALRFLVIWAMFFSGLQKVLHGTYFNGAYLGMLIANQGRFVLPFYFVMPEDELNAIVDGPVTGPYEIHSPIVLLFSNLVYILEILAAVLLAIPRFRNVGVVLTAALLVAIEVAAREYMFGVMVINLLCLFLDEKWSRRGMIFSVVFYSVMLFDAATWNALGGFH